jgi:hypothetical protein
VTLQQNDGVSYQVTQIRRAIAIIALMKFDCRGPRQSPSPRELTPPPVSVIKLVTTKATSESDPICPDDFDLRSASLGRVASASTSRTATTTMATQSSCGPANQTATRTSYGHLRRTAPSGQTASAWRPTEVIHQVTRS